MGDLDGIVTGHREVGGAYRLLTLAPLRPIEAPEAGRFVMVRVSGDRDPLLRRPFGIHDFSGSGADQKLSILYRVCGRGTSRMAAWRPGEAVDVLGPLGRGFRFAADTPNPLIVGGGIGAAPLLYLARRMKEAGLSPAVYLGGNAAADLLARDEFRALGLAVREATMDGSCGVPGTVLDCLLPDVPSGSTASVFACGPPAMLSGLAREAGERGWTMQGSAEAAMACGMGLCLGCATRAAEGAERPYRLVCTDGPVFDLGEVAW